MPVPKKRHTKGRRDRRRKDLGLKAVITKACSKCGKPKLPHKACPNCGTYKGKEVINTVKKTKKSSK